MSADHFEEHYSVLMYKNTKRLLVAQYRYIYIGTEDTAIAQAGIPNTLKNYLGTGGLFAVAWKHVNQGRSHFWRDTRNTEKGLKIPMLLLPLCSCNARYEMS